MRRDSATDVGGSSSVTLRFVVVADTHVQLEEAPAGDFPANRLLAGRNRHAVELIERIAPAFVVHLGDVVHPVPGHGDHPAANELAADAYRRLTVPLHVVPGNHDVGDKPFGFVDAPRVDERHYGRFEGRWGPAYQAFGVEGCRFVLVDTPSIGSDLPRAVQHRRWLEGTLAHAREAGERIFVFGHYPPFLWRSDEPEHYDNLGPEGRAWFLGLVQEYQVEAVFSGHVHHFFHGRHADTDLYVVPATGFVRPGYAELSPIAPTDEFGRDERPKLGMFVVDVGEHDHVVRPVRTYGRVDEGASERIDAFLDPAWADPLGVTMRHGWAHARDLAMDGLDAFVRKRVRDDSAILALWEARIDRVRVPVADIADPDGAERIADLAARGTRFSVVAPAGTAAEIPTLVGIERWELVQPRGSGAFVPPDPPPGVRIAMGPAVPFSSSEWAGGHFVAHGYDPWAPPRRVPVGVDEVVFRIRHDADVWDGIARSHGAAGRLGLGTLALVELPRGGEGQAFVDDAAVANRVVESLVAASAFPQVAVFLDGFVDHDRGYFPRHGLLDRSGSPRPAHRALLEAAAATSSLPGRRWVRRVAGTFHNGEVVVVLARGGERAAAPMRSLITGDLVRATGELTAGPWISTEGASGAPR